MNEQLLGKVINGSYEIIREIARGGMATVYRAHQISMNRDVAIKVLPREFLHEPSFLERFRQEAEIAAHLEHRAIVPVYDYGEWEGTPYIVMRLMEGRSVDNLLERGAIPLEQVQQIVRQVASALDYAHKRGVLHRDLKPSNILLDHSGDAYITDFGIARLLSRAEKLTSTGVVGTPSYMSPEQAQGHDLDGRSDVYALGVVTFEMLTGRRPFDGDTPYSVAVMQVTKQPPSPREYNPNLPPGVEVVLFKALEKDRQKRYQTATELAGALDDADLMPLEQTVPHQAPYPQQPAPYPAYEESHTQPTPQRHITPVSANMPTYAAPLPRNRRSFSPIAYITAVMGLTLVLGIVVLGGYLLLSKDDKQANEPDFAATGVFRLTATANSQQVSALLADGELLYVSDRSGEPDLYRLNLVTGNETRLTNTSGAEGYPAVSPDGQWLAYVYDPDGKFDDNSDTQAEIYVGRMDGTGVRQITSNLAKEDFPTWTPDGTALVFIQITADNKENRIIRYNLSTDEETTLYRVPEQLAYPRVSPDGKSIVFTASQRGESDSSEIWILSIEEGVAKPLTENTVVDWSPSWNPLDNHIIFIRSGTDIMQMQADGSNQTLIYENNHPQTEVAYGKSGLILVTQNNVFQMMGDELVQLTQTGDIYQAIWLAQ